MSARRQFLRTGVAAGAGAALHAFAPARAWAASSTVLPSTTGAAAITDLVIAKRELSIAGRRALPTVVNGLLPGPILRFREGETVTIRVKNELQDTSSIHWHGLIVPADMDGVPGVSFAGIGPGETFTYRYPLIQSGTYWYHSHSGNQEQAGLYGPFIIDAVTPEPYSYDRECIVMLSDWTFEDPARVLAKMKKLGAYYNFNRRTLGDVFRDASQNGWGATISDRALWAKMRMDPTDIAKRQWRRHPASTDRRRLNRVSCNPIAADCDSPWSACQPDPERAVMLRLSLSGLSCQRRCRRSRRPEGSGPA